jgi:hypothetical protein
VTVLEFDSLGSPLCERCMAHWYAMKPRPANPAAYFERLHVMEGHR